MAESESLDEETFWGGTQNKSIPRIANFVDHKPKMINSSYLRLLALLIIIIIITQRGPQFVNRN